MGGEDAATYIKLFPSWDSTSRRFDEIPLFGEATPSYIASRSSCKKMATVVPKAKLIILLREPVARAYSEYQMKSRRIAQQADFLSSVTLYRKSLIRCMIKFPFDYVAITKCVPSKVSQHARWSKLLTAWKRSAKKLLTWVQIIEGCFPNHQSALSVSLFNTRRKYRPNFRNYNSRSLSNESNFNASEKTSFDSTSCWRHYKQGLETIKPLQIAMVDEINDFQACRLEAPIHGGNVERNHSVLSRLELLDSAVDRCLRVRGGISSQYFYRSMYAVQLHHCFKHIPQERCLIIPSGRLRTDTAGVYAEVLSFLGLSGTLHQQQQPVTSSKEETQEVDITGNAVASLRPYRYVNQNALEAPMETEHLVRSAVDKHFPSFARSNGWSLRSEYDPIPEEIAQHMQAFFNEQNQLLFELLGRNLTTEW